MAEPTEKVTCAPALSLVSLEIPAVIRMAVSAENVEEAREIVRAMLGGGDWLQAMVDLGWAPPRRGVEFAVRIP